MSPALTTASLLRRRLRNQHLERPRLGAAEDVVRSLVAVQAQDYSGAAWAIGQRMRDGTRETVDRALDDGRILRTHVLRPTWHLVAPDDLRWLLDLTGPRVRQSNNLYCRRLGISEDMLDRSAEVMVRSLRGGRHLTRPELVGAVAREGITFTDFGHLLALQDAELRALLCSGPRRGRQHTYALLDERAPAARVLDRPAALGELAERYFTGHGPATLADFAWWSGLRVADARAAVERAGAALQEETRGSERYWGRPGTDARPLRQTLHLLPNYDEYTVAFRDRGDLLGPAWSALAGAQSLAMRYVVTWNGAIVGTWRTSTHRSGVAVAVTLDDELPAAAQAALRSQVERYARFLDLPVATTVRRAGGMLTEVVRFR